MQPSLAESARQVGEEFGRFISKLSDGDRAFRQGVLQLDVVTGRKPLFERSRVLFLRDIDLGIEGLACTAGGQTVYFTPVTLLRHWRTFAVVEDADLVRSAYLAQESAEPPAFDYAEKLLTASFVEKRPGGPVFPLYRGNVLLPSADPDVIVQAMSHAGLWFLRTQQPDGSFLPNYFPVDEEAEKNYKLVEHLRAAVAVSLLHQLTGEARFAQARDKALDFCLSKKFVREERSRGLFFLTGDGEEEVTPSALLLTALCYRALADPTPTADGRMKGLGKYLSLMVAPGGELYETFDVATQGNQRYIIWSSAYAETLMALDLLERVSPTEEGRKAAARLAEHLDSFPDEVHVLTDHRGMGRVAEALAEHYKLTHSDPDFAAVLKIADVIIGLQLKAEDAPFADFVGGFAIAKLAPETLATAECACGLAAAYDVSIVTRKPAGRFSIPLLDAARFLMNMQYRAENTFYLNHKEVILGAFRRSPYNLGLHLGATAEAVRALMLAEAVAEETTGPRGARSEPPEKPAAH
jgi:hypothetical protein